MRSLGLILSLLLSLNLSALDVSIDHASFSTSDKSYVELYFHYVASTLEHETIPAQGLQARVASTILIKRNDEIVQFDKFELSGPINERKKDFQDIKRFFLEPGKYVISVEIIDQHNKLSIYNSNIDIEVSGIVEGIRLSDIQYMASIKKSDAESKLSKQGIQFEILPFDYLNSKFEMLHFYTEVYRGSSIEDLYLEYGIYSGYAGQEEKLVSKGTKRIGKEAIVPMLKSVDIADLPSGNYHLKVDVINRAKEILASANKNFQRNNPTVDIEILQESDDGFEVSFVHTIPKDRLDYYLKAHIPVVTSAALSGLNEVLKRGSDRNKRYFIYRHWSTKSKEHSAALFEKYMEVAGAIDKMYNSGFGYGFETDRGYIYLKYGRPTQSIAVDDEISAPPYEIWAYDRIPETGQNNVKFIFYNPNLAHNGFKLLHSTCRGENFNPAWEIELYRDAVTEDNGSTIDATSVKDNFNRNARRLFNDL